MRISPEWGLDPVERAKFDRNAVEIPRYASIEQEAALHFRNLVTLYTGQTIDRRTFISRFRERLQEAEIAAFVAGKRAKGLTVDSITDAEAAMLDTRHALNMEYFRAFVADIDAGRGRMPYGRRASLYAKSLWSIYTRGETIDWNEDDPNIRGFWIMDVDAEHCNSCLERARLSRENGGFSFRELTMIGWPGERTICMVNCRCHIRVVRKRAVEPDRIEDARPAETPETGLERLEKLVGGATMPLRIPAAGLPPVKLKPEAVADSMYLAGMKRDILARLAPLLPRTLIKPELVIDRGETRYFVAPWLEAALGRDPESGLWSILYFVLGKNYNLWV